MNFLNYTLQLTDRWTSTLSKVGVSTGTATQQVRNLKGEVNSLNNVSLSGFYSSIQKISAFLGIGAVLGQTIKLGMEQEMRNTSFEVLFGGVDNAKKIIDDISIYAAKSPYGKEGLSEAVKTMAGFGVAQEAIIPNLRAIGDIAMGNKERMASLSLAFSQMTATGRLMGQDLLQMVNAGFNPLSQISKETGKSIGTLKDEMEKGLISSKMVENAFQNATKEGGLYHGMIDKINQTSSGQWATATDNMREKLLSLYNDVLQPVLLPGLKLFNEFLTNPIETIGRLADKISTDFPIMTTVVIATTAAVAAYRVTMLSLAGIQVVITAIKSALVAYEIVVFAVTNATSLWQAAQWLLNVALTANPVGIVIAAIVALIALIAYLIIKIDGWGEAWQHTVNGAKLVFQAYTEFVKANFNTMVQAVMVGINTIKEGWYSFKSTLGIGDSSETESILSQIRADTEARKKSVGEGYKKAWDLSKQAGQSFVNAAGSLKWNDTSFSDVPNKLKDKIGLGGNPGIAAPTIPGTPDDLTGSTDGKGKGGKGKAARDTANAIATGGTKTTYITVNVGEMGNDMKIYVSSAKEGAENIRDIILDQLTRVFSMAQGQI